MVCKLNGQKAAAQPLLCSLISSVSGITVSREGNWNMVVLLIADLENHLNKRVKTFGIVLLEVIAHQIGEFKDAVGCIARQEIGNPAVAIGGLFIHKSPGSGHLLFQADLYAAGGRSARHVQD